MNSQEYLDLIACSLNIARSKAKKGKLDHYQTGFHTGQIAAYMNLGYSHSVNAAAADAQTEINHLFKGQQQ